MSDRTLESYVSEIAANTDKTANYLKDIRSLLTDHRVREVLIESQCNHIVGTFKDGTSGKTYLGSVSDKRESYKYHKMFYFCPECGSKLR